MACRSDYVNRTERFILSGTTFRLEGAMSQNDKIKAFPAGKSSPQSRETVEEATIAGPEAAKTAPPKRSRRPLVLGTLALVLLAGGGWYGYDFWTNGRFMVGTDDAYVLGDIATISPKLSGYVAQLNVVANQPVKAGDPLVTLDDGDYQLALDTANANIAAEKLAMARIDAQTEGARASLAQAEAQLAAYVAARDNAILAQKRAAQLAAQSVGSQADLDSANAGLKASEANVAAGEAQIASAEAAISVYQAQRAEAQGQVKVLEIAAARAQRDLSFTVLRAPFDGVVGNLNVKDGDLVSSGSRLMALVPTHELYVDANFKETQLARIAVGETVKVTVDALEGESVEGRVESISPASGSVFSILPAQNATGNFTKVVQRVPVRIALPAEVLESGKLRAGLSVAVEIDTRTAPGATP
jgi:membrane fusion protein (multidrug efflux system)